MFGLANTAHFALHIPTVRNDFKVLAFDGVEAISAIDEVLRWARFHAVLGTDFPDAPAHAAYRSLLAEHGVSPEQRLDNLKAELMRQQLTNKESCV
jgi:hypothetical protein